MDSTGILYVAAGKKYINAAVQSALSVRAHSPNLPTHLFSNYQEFGFSFDKSPFPFSSIGVIEAPHRRSKIDYMARSPYDRTLYLDTDTALNADISDIFRILDRFDVALCHAHRRNEGVRTQTWQVELPDSFPQFNSGVILYKKNPKTLDLFDSWIQAFHAAGFPHDQLTLRELLWMSDLRIATLPPEYNVRFKKYHYLWSRSEAATKIFHLRRYHDGRLWFLKRWAKKLLRPLYYRIKPPAGN